MLTKEYEILKPFADKPWLKIALSQVKQCSKKKSKGYVYGALQAFVKKNILKEEKAGNVTLYSLNLDSILSQAYAGFTAEHVAWNKKQLPLGDLQRITRRIPTPFFILLITGSYASSMQKKESDIDVAIICDDSAEPKKIYAELKHECEMNIPPVHLYVFRKSEFLEMLLSSKQNYGKELARNNALLYGGQEYFRIIGEATKNGFNG